MKKSRILFIIIIQFLLFGSNGLAQVQLLDAKIIVNKNSSAYWDDNSVIAEQGDIIYLSVALSARLESMYSQVYLSNHDSLIIGNKPVDFEQIYRIFKRLSNKPTIRWYRVKPVNLDTIYQNFRGSVTPFAVIPYEEILIPEWSNQWEVDIRSLTNYDQIFPGTVWLKVEVRHGREMVSSPGCSHRQKVYDNIDFGGLSPDVFRVSIKDKTGSRFLDNFLLYRNIPVIINPESISNLWKDHQTACWIGGNLSSFAVSSANMLGTDIIEWQAKLAIPELNYFKITDYYQNVVVLSGDYYRTKQGETILLGEYRFKPGDIIIGNNQTALFYRDCSPFYSAMQGEANEILDRLDLVIECNQNTLRIRTIEELFGDTITLIYWKKSWSFY